MHSEKIRVAVYGTLKQNQSNHWLLADQERCGEFQCDLITLYDLGLFPAAKLSNSDGVRVEVYEVDDETFARLDKLEGFNSESPESGLYNRIQIQTPFGQAWLYIYNHDVSGYPEIRSGEWFPCRS